MQGDIMKYIVDNDLHIHSMLSLCSGEEEQTKTNILKYGVENGLKTICLTDHFWDDAVDGASEWYGIQNFGHISKAKPLPTADGIKFLFGCETELASDYTLALARENFDLFDFIIIPTTHFHFVGLTLTEEQASTVATRAKAWVDRFEAVLNMNLPFHKIGIAHLTCHLIAPTHQEFLDVMNSIPESEMERLFKKAAELGVGIELNGSDMVFDDADEETIMRPYKIAKKCGCKFYCGSDAHNVDKFETCVDTFKKAVDILELTEDDKFIIK